MATMVRFLCFVSCAPGSILVADNFSDLLDHSPEDEQLENKAEALFGKNYPRLQELKKKYDPENIFNKWFAITPCA